MDCGRVVCVCQEPAQFADAARPEGCLCAKAVRKPRPVKIESSADKECSAWRSRRRRPPCSHFHSTHSPPPARRLYERRLRTTTFAQPWRRWRRRRRGRRRRWRCWWWRRRTQAAAPTARVAERGPLLGAKMRRAEGAALLYGDLAAAHVHAGHHRRAVGSAMDGSRRFFSHLASKSCLRFAVTTIAQFEAVWAR